MRSRARILGLGGFGSLSRVNYILGTWRLRAGADVFGRSRIDPSLAKSE